jgi:hypothetical protein
MSDTAPPYMSNGQALPGARNGLRPAGVLTAIGACCVVLGGLVAAATGPLDLARGSWLAAYLVLVAGVAQCAMGQARTRRPDVARSRRWDWTHICCWNLGNAVVIGGTLAGVPLMVDTGSVLLVVALAIALHTARRPAGAPARPLATRMPTVVDWAYRALLLVLAVSIPVGMALSHLRST